MYFLYLMKVHGGTTEDVIAEKVQEAIERAEDNRKQGFRHYTILFFDEANTTEAIGLIKEIMCDRRFHGKQIPENIKFIAACNPYRQYVFFMNVTYSGKVAVRRIIYDNYM